MQNIALGNKFKSRFTGRIFKVKKIHMNTVLLEDVGDKDHQVTTEITTVLRFYQSVDK